MEQRISIVTTGPLFDGRASDAFQTAADEFVDEVVWLLETEVKANTPVGVFGSQGGLLAGIHGQVYVPGTPLVYGVVGHQSVYGDIVERGRQPGKMPPKGSLLRWIEVVLGKSEAEAKSLEFVIRRAIAAKGTDGAAMFYKAFESSHVQIAKIASDKGLTIASTIDGAP